MSRWPVVELVPWTGPVPPAHPDANFLADVATMSLVDPMPTLQRLADAVGVPVGALARMVLARWVSDGAAALAASGPAVVERMAGLVDRVDAAIDSGQDPDAARAAGWDDLAEQVRWLTHGLDDPAATYPGGGASSD